MAGLERNADIVEMSSYAPLFAHTDAWQWAPNLIWFDNLRSFGTANYEVQKLFSLNRGDQALPVVIRHPPVAVNGTARFFACAGRDVKTGELVVKVVNATAEPVKTVLSVNGGGPLQPDGSAVVLAAGLDDENSLECPEKIVPKEAAVSGVSSRFTYSFGPYSVTVLRLKEG